jgi:hypothetical protein
MRERDKALGGDGDLLEIWEIPRPRRLRRTEVDLGALREKHLLTEFASRDEATNLTAAQPVAIWTSYSSVEATPSP